MPDLPENHSVWVLLSHHSERVPLTLPHICRHRAFKKGDDKNRNQSRKQWRDCTTVLHLPETSSLRTNKFRALLF